MVDPLKLAVGTKVMFGKSASKISCPTVIFTPFNLSNPFAGRLTTLILVRASPSTSVNFEVKSRAVNVIVASSAPAFGISATTGRSFTGVILKLIVFGL